MRIQPAQNQQNQPNFRQLVLKLPVKKDLEVVQDLGEKLKFNVMQKHNQTDTYHIDTKHNSLLERVLKGILNYKKNQGILSESANFVAK